MMSEFGHDFPSAAVDDLSPAAVKRWLARLSGAFHESEVRGMMEDALAAAQGRDWVSVPTGSAMLPTIDFRRWEGDPPPRQSLWGEWLPIGQTTMLTGRGGIGKSLLAQCLSAAVALGKPFLGMPTEPRKALYVTAEDDADELWRRMAAIAEAFNVRLSDLSGRLYLVSLCGSTDTALATFDPKTGGLLRTPRWDELNSTVETLGIGFTALDNASDMMAGDHNDLHQVAEFVNLLTGLALRSSGATMILHHPNKADDDWLGSVAWHNKVRSRLFVKGVDSDPDARVISNPKANYGPQGSEISFRWYAGAFFREEELTASYGQQVAESARAAADNIIFLKCLAERNRQQRPVSEKTGANFAPAAFAGMPLAKGLSKERLRAAMDRLFSLGTIERGLVFRDTAEGRDRFGLIVSANASANSPQTRIANDRERAEINRKHTPLHTTYVDGAAHRQAAPSDDDQPEDFPPGWEAW